MSDIQNQLDKLKSDLETSTKEAVAKAHAIHLVTITASALAGFILALGLCMAHVF